MTEKKFIDVDRVLKEKAKTAYKFMPRLLINWLKKKLHEEDINIGMVHMGQYNG